MASQASQLFGGNLNLTVNVVAHAQRIADRTGDPLLKETANRAHSALSKGTKEGVNLTWITPEQANELLNLAIKTQDRELADFARYCQSVADTSGIGVEPTPGKIQQEIEKGRTELQQQGPQHTGRGYGAAFASASQQAGGQGQRGPQQGGQLGQQQGQQLFGGNLKLTPDVVAHCQRIADRTGDPILKQTASRAQAALMRGGLPDANVHLTWITPDQATELVNIAIRTQDRELADFARYCQSVAATSGVGLEPTPGMIQQEIQKGRQELQEHGRVHTGPGYGAAFGSLAQAGQIQGQGLGQRQSQGIQQPTLEEPLFGGSRELNADVVAYCQRIADRTGDPVLKLLSSRAQSALSGGQADPNLRLMWVTPDLVSQLAQLANRSGDKEICDFARYCQSVCSTTGIAIESKPGSIQQEVEKGKKEVLQQPLQQKAQSQSM